MESYANPDSGRIKDATGEYYGWPKIAALAFYGSKDEVKNYLLANTYSIEEKIQIAKDTQCFTKHTLIGKNFTAYQLINLRCKSVTKPVASIFCDGTKISKNEYMDLLVQHTGLFAIHEYLEAKIANGVIGDPTVSRRVKIFSNLLLAIKNDDKNQVMKIINAEHPVGMVTQEFHDLLIGLGGCNYFNILMMFQEYNKHITSIKLDKESSLVKILTDVLAGRANDKINLDEFELKIVRSNK